ITHRPGYVPVLRKSAPVLRSCSISGSHSLKASRWTVTPIAFRSNWHAGCNGCPKRACMNKILAVAALAMLAACSSQNNPTNPGSAGNPARPCEIKLSGALNGTYDCAGQAASGVWSSSNNIGAVVLYGPDGDSATTIAISVGAREQLRTGTFSSMDTGAWGMMSIVGGTASSLYSMFADGSSPGSNFGGYSLKLTSVTESGTGGDAKLYNVHGTLSATLPADRSSTTTGTVTLIATF